MILFFSSGIPLIYALECSVKLSGSNIKKLNWLFGGASIVKKENITGFFIGPRKEMVTPWSTNAVEITQNMGIKGIQRIEEFIVVDSEKAYYDPMLQAFYQHLDQDIFAIQHVPEPIKYIDDIAAYNLSEGLALNDEEIEYLKNISRLLNRKLTDSEIFGFSQVNSEHCRHKIFNGTFIINGKEMPESLFQLIKNTTQQNPNIVISAYRDNVAFIDGPRIEQFAPKTQDKADFFEIKPIDTVISLKAETHNFPTTVEPFNGAATGSGGEIRDRMAGGKGSLPLAGTAVYMTSYPRLNGSRPWETSMPERKWLYQTPEQILIKASNGASDFGNKFGQPLICGSLLTFEYSENETKYGYDKVIMLAGGIGFAKKSDAQKDHPVKGDRIVVMGGDNYRIGMGGGAVSSVATGEYHSAIELNAIQRSNPEMQKRVYNAIRAMTETDENKIISIHDHGAGGHLNCLSELVEQTGGEINMKNLPVGDTTLSDKEIIGNESQERMGLVMKNEDIDLLKQISERERAPFYDVGEITGDEHLRFIGQNGNKPIDLKLEYLFGNPPKTTIYDEEKPVVFKTSKYDPSKLMEYLEQVLQLESVACKDWLTNKVDRSVTGRVAFQQTAGQIQLPVNDVAVMALDYRGIEGVATSIGHAPVAGLVNAASGSILAVAEALTNLVFAPIKNGLQGVSLSANWMWPSKNQGEDARLYKAVKAISDFCISLGINIPTGKDSLSMTQKYPDGDVVYSPGTVIVSSVGEVTDIRKVVSAAVQPIGDTYLIYIDFSYDRKKLGGSSLSQILMNIGNEVPGITDPGYFTNAFNTVQQLINEAHVLSGHDISAGGMITCLLEMLFTNNNSGLQADLTDLEATDIIHLLFSENPGIIIQVQDKKFISKILSEANISHLIIGQVTNDREFLLKYRNHEYQFDINSLRETWYLSSYLLDRKQSGEKKALERFTNYKNQSLKFAFNKGFSGKLAQFNITLSRKEQTGIKAAIIREKGVNGDREMAYLMHLAGFDVKDVHMTDLISGKRNFERY